MELSQCDASKQNRHEAPRPHPAGRQQAALVGLMFLGFVSLGLPDGLLGVAWPSMAASNAVGLDALGWLIAAASLGFLAASVLSGRLLARPGVGVLLALSCLLTALSLLGFAVAPAWWLLLPLALLLGAGGGAIDAGLNTYAAATHGPRVLSWLHACYGLGAAAGPIVMASLLAAGRPWQLGYALVGAGQLALAVCFALTRGHWRAGGAAPALPQRSGPGLRSTLALPLVWLSAAVFLLYTGLEVTAGQWSFTLFTRGRGVEASRAGAWISLYWAGLTVGRIAAGALAGRITPQRMLWLGALGATAGALLVGLVPMAWASVSGLLLMGVALAPIFPALIATTAQRVGAAHAANTIGLQVAAANLGAALIPWAVGQGVGAGGPRLIGPALIAAAVAYLALFALLARHTRA
ncbi:MAG: MFS transporter [Chloroflexi bacterium]|nr:MFS transporter [Chloroflexota bacterium]